MTGDTTGRSYDSAGAMTLCENVRVLYERGDEPYRAIVARGRELGQDVFVSVRMNDNHFYGLLPDAMPSTTVWGLTRLRKEHPDWCLTPAQVVEERGIGSWNFAYAGVREHMLAYIAEACEQADWDGVEIDWQRHGFYFPHADAWRLRYLLTDVMRQVRALADGIARKRGRQFYVATRVAATVEACRQIGYDVEEWMNDGLCDIVIGAGMSGTDPDFQVERFRDMASRRSVRVYGGFDSLYRQSSGPRLKPHMQNDERRLPLTAGGYTANFGTDRFWDERWVRGTAQCYLERGADGIYIFNWQGTSETWRGLLTAIGSKETLAGKDKVYAAVHGGERHFDRIFAGTPVTLYPTLTGDGPPFSVPVYDDAVGKTARNPAGIELQVDLAHFATGDEVAVTLDGAQLPPPDVRNTAAENANNPSDVSENSWLVWKLEPGQAGYGPHEVMVRLVRRDARIKPPIVVQHVEIHVNYE